jgi:hypothetical protein
LLLMNFSFTINSTNPFLSLLPYSISFHNWNCVWHKAIICWVMRGQPGGIIHIGLKNNHTSELDTTLLPKALRY